MDTVELLNQITELSHKFGTDKYVCGGGGNTSAKNKTTLWVKPSGTTLKDIVAHNFVDIDRTKLAKLYEITPPQESSSRETLVKQVMAEAIITKKSLRASVEAPLHDSLDACFVVHTHPAIVNGMTCAKDGKTFCEEIFTEALWLDYIDPGYTLCMHVRKKIKEYKEKFGKEPEVIFLKNHGVFVSAQNPEDIRRIYNYITETLCKQYKNKGISPELEIAELTKESKIDFKLIKLKEIFEGFSFSYSGCFDYANSPISPDHIVYSKSYPFTGEPSLQLVNEFRNKHGYLPQILIWDDVIFGLGQTEKKAYLALELFKDGALIKKLADTFGGISYMTDTAREFIENWEVESYRSKQL